MGIFDKKSTSSSTATDVTTTSTVVDNRVGGAGSSIGGNITVTGAPINIGSKNKNVNVTQTDYGAIAAGIGVSRDALAFATTQGANAFAFADKASGDATLQALGAQDVVRQANELNTGLASKTVTELTGLTGSIANNLTSVAQGAISQISGVVKRANESDSVEIFRMVAFALVGGGIIYYLLKGAK